ncbi:MAG TPA: hypothetical protein PLU95_09590 [Syntrophales bacterium]|nr:hypothetical protein [Syntrophales bacterium]HPN09542.1 hypothetical protein [Syntrophales bacterium]HPX82447.1 hypothetical protein [Syntrophales bacterium]HQB14344.1 hypothetical protein [Syntrophales bacterium]HQK78169.1 hypothetical protein [Syntrophales bacterium]
MNGCADHCPEGFLSRLRDEFLVSWDDARTIVGNFHEEMRRGLAGQPSSLRMLPTFAGRPRGTEQGRLLILDLGGTNVRIGEAVLDGKGRAELTSVDRSVLPREIMSASGTELFDFLADRVDHFLGGRGLDDRWCRDLAFTFSFPVEQSSLVSGRLVNWTKGFTGPGVAGEDVAALLRAALARRGRERIRVAALVNDTVGTLAAGSYADPACDLGVILGTGTNACYFERTDRIEKCRDGVAAGEMIVNMEWGNFNRLRTNPWDELLDRTTSNAGRQRLEKMISGMYLGELARLVIGKMMAVGLLPQGTNHAALATPYALTAERLAAAVRSTDPAGAVGIEGAAPVDGAAVGQICRLVAARAARLAGAAIAAVISWRDEDLETGHVVAIDGSLFEKFPGFQENMREMLRELFGPRAAGIQFQLIPDGSGIGAAVVAAMGARTGWGAGSC